MTKALGQRLDEAAAFIRGRTDLVPQIALVLGSGLGDLADAIGGGGDTLWSDPALPFADCAKP